MSAAAHTAKCFPREDVEFANVVAACELELGPKARDDPLALERCVRRMYPSARVRPRAALASDGFEGIWYVFRDGRLEVSREAPGAAPAE